MKTRVQDQTTLLEAIFSDYPIAVAVLDQEMKYTYASDFWYKFHQLNGQHIIGCSHWEVLPETLKNETWLNAYQQAEKGEVVELDQEGAMNYNGISQWVHWRLKPWRDVDTQEQLGVMLYAETVSKFRYFCSSVIWRRSS